MNGTFGEKIRNLREDADLNQSELGKAVGMTQRKVSYIERGQYEPNLGDIVALCRYFKVSSDFLLGIPKEYGEKGKNQ